MQVTQKGANQKIVFFPQHLTSYNLKILRDFLFRQIFPLTASISKTTRIISWNRLNNNWVCSDRGLKQLEEGGRE